jgi:hypothetical protein
MGVWLERDGVTSMSVLSSCYAGPVWRVYLHDGACQSDAYVRQA